MSTNIENRDIKNVNINHKEIDLTATSIMTLTSQMTTIGADYVKVLIDVQCRVCTFLFFRKHIIPQRSDKGDKVELKGVNDEGFLEVKVPFETAFALSTYMNETIKNIKKDPTIGLTFGPSETVL